MFAFNKHYLVMISRLKYDNYEEEKKLNTKTFAKPEETRWDTLEFCTVYKT